MHAIAKRTPATNDKDLQASLEHSCGLRLEERRVVMAGESDLMATLTSSTGNFKPSIDLLQRALEPAPDTQLERAIGVLWVKMAKRAGSDAELDLILAAYVAELRRFPADIALRVLTEWPRHPDHVWWPAWAELEDELQRLSRWRRAAIEACRFAALEHAPLVDEPKSAEVAAGLAALSATLRGGAGVPSPLSRKGPEQRVQTKRPVRTPDQQIAALRADVEAEQRAKS